METPDTHTQLIGKLAEELGPVMAQHLASRLAETTGKPNQVEGVSLLLDELTEISPKSSSHRHRVVSRAASARPALRCGRLAGSRDCID